MDFRVPACEYISIFSVCSLCAVFVCGNGVVSDVGCVVCFAVAVNIPIDCVFICCPLGVKCQAANRHCCRNLSVPTCEGITCLGGCFGCNNCIAIVCLDRFDFAAAVGIKGYLIFVNCPCCGNCYTVNRHCCGNFRYPTGEGVTCLDRSLDRGDCRAVGQGNRCDNCVACFSKCDCVKVSVPCCVYSKAVFGHYCGNLDTPACEGVAGLGRCIRCNNCVACFKKLLADNISVTVGEGESVKLVPNRFNSKVVCRHYLGHYIKLEGCPAAEHEAFLIGFFGQVDRLAASYVILEVNLVVNIVNYAIGVRCPPCIKCSVFCGHYRRNNCGSAVCIQPTEEGVAFLIRHSGCCYCSAVILGDRRHFVAAVGVEADGVLIRCPLSGYGHVVCGHCCRNCNVPACKCITFPCGVSRCCYIAAEVCSDGCYCRAAVSIKADGILVNSPYSLKDKTADRHCFGHSYRLAVSIDPAGEGITGLGCCGCCNCSAIACCYRFNRVTAVNVEGDCVLDRSRFESCDIVCLARYCNRLVAVDYIIPSDKLVRVHCIRCLGGCFVGECGNCTIFNNGSSYLTLYTPGDFELSKALGELSGIGCRTCYSSKFRVPAREGVIILVIRRLLAVIVRRHIEVIYNGCVINCSVAVKIPADFILVKLPNCGKSHILCRHCFGNGDYVALFICPVKECITCLSRVFGCAYQCVVILGDRINIVSAVGVECQCVLIDSPLSVKCHTADRHFVREFGIPACEGVTLLSGCCRFGNFVTDASCDRLDFTAAVGIEVDCVDTRICNELCGISDIACNNAYCRIPLFKFIAVDVVCFLNNLALEYGCITIFIFFGGYVVVNDPCYCVLINGFSKYRSISLCSLYCRDLTVIILVTVVILPTIECVRELSCAALYRLLIGVLSPQRNIAVSNGGCGSYTVNKPSNVILSDSCGIGCGIGCGTCYSTRFNVPTCKFIAELCSAFLNGCAVIYRSLAIFDIS